MRNVTNKNKKSRRTIALKRMKAAVKRVLIKNMAVRKYDYGRLLYYKYLRQDQPGKQPENILHFLLRNSSNLFVPSSMGNKAKQISALLNKLSICPVENNTFFYAIDYYKRVRSTNRILDNYTVDYSMIVQSSLVNIANELEKRGDTEFARNELSVVDSLRGYLERCKEDGRIVQKYQKQIEAIETLFKRPAETLFEGLQRILFYNQFLWQTGHTLNGFGRLDVILDDVYKHDLECGTLTRKKAGSMIRDFFRVLHEYYWFKSAGLMGDTGQIIILGGRMQTGGYFRNELTDLFIEVSEELRLPDPKILLRCTADMPEDLLEKALGCIATGIGAPLLSNDDTVIPALISNGYEPADAYQYGTSACWEPLIPGITSDQNNVTTFNFAVPIIRMFDDRRFEEAGSMEEILKYYKVKLHEYIAELLDPLSELIFEEDPLLSLVSPSTLKAGEDITRGGAKYNNLGLTSVGIGTVVNSLMNLQRLVFDEKRYSIKELNVLRRQDFIEQFELLEEMKSQSPCYGCDDNRVIMLTRGILEFASQEFEKYHTPLGGHFKFGLSSPSYIVGAKSVGATFDGRRAGDPFSVHISAAAPLPTTQLLSFAMQLDYRGNRLNGNVIDFFVSPGMLNQNLKKYAALLRTGFQGGIFQLQMNVVESKTLIAAKTHPELFPQLVVRVWGFSAYFNDLPEEYKDVLIARAIESEKAA